MTRSPVGSALVSLVSLASLTLPAACGGAPDGEAEGSTAQASSYFTTTTIATNDGSGVAAVSQPTVPGAPIDAFYVAPGAARAIQWVHYSISTGWSAPTTVASGAWSAPAAGLASGTLDVVYVSSTGQICGTYYSSGAWSTPGCGAAGTAAGGVALMAMPSSGLIRRSNILFYRGTNGHLWAYASLQSMPVDLGAPIAGAPAPVYRPSNGQINVFYRGANGHLFDVWFDGSSWHPGWDHGFAIAGDPAALVSKSDSRIDVYYPEVVGGAVVLSQQTWLSSGGWGADWPTGLPASSTAPAVTGPTQVIYGSAGKLMEASGGLIWPL